MTDEIMQKLFHSLLPLLNEDTRLVGVCSVWFDCGDCLMHIFWYGSKWEYELVCKKDIIDAKSIVRPE